MSRPSAEEQLRMIVRSALARAFLSQAEAARRVGLSTKHMSQMLSGRATLTLDWAERILALCGARLFVTAIWAEPRKDTTA
jgi:transcriptional regulator with XRE-family HTH domain